MNDATDQMLKAYACRTRDDHVNALREILQQVALLGLWRAKFFEHAAFYGGTALRILHGLDRYSEDLDFSLLKPNPGFRLDGYGDALQREMAGFGFDVRFEARNKTGGSAIASAFLKANTLRQLIVVNAGASALAGLHGEAVLKIKLEVDTDPPGGFETVSRPVLQPIPFAVNTYSLPDLFAGKMHALLCRRWRNRVKGRDWYDLVWYLARHPQLRLGHLEQRMRQSGDWTDAKALDRSTLLHLLSDRIKALEVSHARKEVEPFVRDKASVQVWSRDFFLGITDRVVTI